MDEKERDEMNRLLAVADDEEEAEEVIDVNEVLAKLAPEQRTIIIKAFMAMNDHFADHFLRQKTLKPMVK